MVMAYMGGLHYWWPKITGRLYSQWWSRLAALIIFVGFFLTFLPQFVVGYNGMPRRYHRYVPEFQVWNVLSSAGASILARRLSAAAVLSASIRCATASAADDNPWRATGLEWQTPSPPPRTISPRRRSSSASPYEYHTGKARMSLETRLFTRRRAGPALRAHVPRASSARGAVRLAPSSSTRRRPSGCGSSWRRK